MNPVRLSFFERLLIKLALAKAVARGHSVAGQADSLKEELRRISASADASQ